MNDILKQRLVGALILVALGVVFWPIIFVEPGDAALEELRRIPARPVVDTAPISAPDKKGLRESMPLESRKEVQRQQEAIDSAQKAFPSVAQAAGEKPAVKTIQPKTSKSTKRTRTEAPIKPAIDSEGVPIAWILQVASVSQAEKAEELRKRLLTLGYKAYVKKIQRSGDSLLRVYVGPKFERAKLDKMKAEIDREFGVRSMVLRYIP
ncbi:MAG: DedD protein [Halioglobus sp.]